MTVSAMALKWDNGIFSMGKAQDFHNGRAAQVPDDNDGNQYNKRPRDVVSQQYEKRAMNLHVLDTHGASILKVAKTAMEALDPQNSAAEMRHVVKNCRMRLDVLMDEANAAARALIESDAADEA